MNNPGSPATLNERTIMAQELQITKPSEVRDDWKTIAVELLGTQTHIVRGPAYEHRVIEAGTDANPPLILLHGIGGHAETYARNMHRLATRFHVFAADALYHGYSSKDGYVHAHRTERQADALADLVVALGYQDAYIEGESMGANITFDLAMRHPERARKVVLNTGGGHDVKLERTNFAQNPGGGDDLKDLSTRSVKELGFATMRKRMEWLVADPTRMTDEMVEVRLRLYADPEIYQSMLKVYGISTAGWRSATPRYSEANVKERWSVEALVFWSEHNPGDGPEYGEYLADLIPGAKYYCMADAAHWPQWEHPEEHDEVLATFFTGTGLS